MLDKLSITGARKNARNLQCDFCGKSFTEKSNMLKYRVLHTVKRTYACHLCDDKYKGPSYLKDFVYMVRTVLSVLQNVQVQRPAVGKHGRHTEISKLSDG